MINMETDIIIYCPFIVSLFSFISLFINGWNKDESKLILSYFMLFGSVFFGIFIFRSTNNLLVYNYLHILSITLLLNACPLLYFYIRSLTFYHGNDKSDILHFIPSFIALYLGSLLYFSLDYNERIFFLKNQDYHTASINLHFKALYFLQDSCKYFFYLQTVIYYVKSRIILQKHRKSLNSLFSDNFGFELNWVKLFLNFLAIWAIFSITANAFLTNHIHFFNQISLYAHFFQCVLIVVLYTMALTQKQLPLHTSFNQINNNHFTNNHLKDKLLLSFEEKQIFLKKDLTIWDVCRETNSNRTYISKLINEEFGMNFNSFVNKYRVEKALTMLKNEDYHKKPIDEIAFLSGFNSLASFNRVFKKATNSSPGYFRIKNGGI